MFSSCVVKLTAYCNLDCSYCYMFNLADHTHRRVPRELSADHGVRLVERIAEHLERSGGRRFRIVLHGGEPTLWPLSSFVKLFDAVERVRAGGYDIGVSLQTNGLRLRSDLLGLLSEHCVSLGISLDGPAPFHDRYRVDHAGRGSYERIMRNVHSMLDRGFGDLLGGFLAVAQPDIPPEDFLDWVASLPVPRADVLWPIDHNHHHPPWPDGGWDAYRRAPRYGLWFGELFERWWEKDDPDLHIRLFFEVIERLLGSRSHTDVIGNDELDLFVINTDGAFEYPDHLRAFTDGGSATPYDLDRHALDQVALDPLFASLGSLREHRAGVCDSCAELELCGGGFLAGRMRGDRPRLDLRSVLCADQYYFFATVRRAVAAVLEPRAGAIDRVVPFGSPLDDGRTLRTALPVIPASAAVSARRFAARS